MSYIFDLFPFGIAIGRKNVRLQMRIDINLNDTYEIEIRDSRLTDYTFDSPVVGGGKVRILVKIRLVSDPFLKDFINLSYGPPIEIEGEVVVDDFASIQHVDPSKVLSTVLLCGLIFLKSNPAEFIGINGSDIRRSYLYYRIILKNLSYLENYFKMIGAKFFVRVLRGWYKDSPPTIDSSELIYTPHTIEKMSFPNYESLYNYFLIYLR